MDRGPLPSLQLVVIGVGVGVIAAASGAARGADGAEPSAVTTAVASPAPRTERASNAEGLDHRWLPLESRTQLLDYVARNVPGALWGRDGGLRLRGGDPRDTVFHADGFSLRRPSLPIGIVGQATVLTAGYGADLGDVPGGAILTELRSGTNTLEAEADVFHDLGDPAASVVAATLAGPLVRDRLFVLLGVRGADVRGGAPIGPESVYLPAPRPTARDFSGALKVTWRATGNHRFDSLTLVDLARSENGEGGEVAPDAQPTRTAGGLFTSLRWIGEFGRLRARSQIAFDRARGELQPRICREKPAECDQIPPVTRSEAGLNQLFENGTLREERTERQWQVVSSLETRVSEGGAIAHRLRLTSRVTMQSFDWGQSTPGDKIVGYGPRPEPERQTEVFANDPRLAAPVYGPATFVGSTLHSFHALEDQIRMFDRLWLSPGLGLAFSRARIENWHAFRDLAFTQHLGLAWDVGGDRRTWVRGSTHRRVQPELESLARFALGTRVERRCDWDPLTMAFSANCTHSGGAAERTVGLPCSPDGLADSGDRCRQPFASPHTWEHTIAVRRALATDLDLDLDLVYRRTTGLPRLSETNRVWPAANGARLSTGGFRNGRNAAVADSSTSIDNQRRYLGGTLWLSKRAGVLRVAGAYTLSRLEGNAPTSLFLYRATLLGPGPYLVDVEPDDRTHGVRLLATYDLRGHASVGLVYAYDSGAVFRRVYLPVSGAAGPGLVNRGTNDEPLRLPGTNRLNLQARWRLQPLLGADLDLYLDVINLLGESFVDNSDAPTFAPGPRLRGPRWYRLGVEYRY